MSMTDAAEQTYAKIDPEFKREWVEALRSNRYGQVSAALRNFLDDDGHREEPSGFCCLGVACDLVDPDAWIDEPAEDDEGDPLWDSRDGWGWRSPDGTVMDPGFTSSFPFLADPNAIDQLVSMNDEKGVGFLAIADWIEENL